MKKYVVGWDVLRFISIIFVADFHTSQYVSNYTGWRLAATSLILSALAWKSSKLGLKELVVLTIPWCLVYGAATTREVTTVYHPNDFLKLVYIVVFGSHLWFLFFTMLSRIIITVVKKTNESTQMAFALISILTVFCEVEISAFSRWWHMVPGWGFAWFYLKKPRLFSLIVSLSTVSWNPSMMQSRYLMATLLFSVFSCWKTESKWSWTDLSKWIYLVHPLVTLFLYYFCVHVNSISVIFVSTIVAYVMAKDIKWKSIWSSMQVSMERTLSALPQTM